MGGRWTALCAALALALTLTACGAGERDGTAGRLSSRGASEARRNLLEDGRYHAGADGRVSPEKPGGESEWEKLGRELRESWDRMMDGGEAAARDVKQGVRNQMEAE